MARRPEATPNGCPTQATETAAPMATSPSLGITRVIRVIPSDGLVAIGAAVSVACVGHPLGVASGLRAIFVNGIAGEFASTGPQFGRPADHGDGQQRLGAAILAVGNEVVRRRRRDGRAFVDALEVPIRCMVVRVELPVVARLRVATGPVQGEIAVRQLVRGGEGDAVDEGADRMAVELSIDGDGDGSVGHRRGAAPDQRYVVQVKDRLRTPNSILKPETGKVWEIGRAQSSQ